MNLLISRILTYLNGTLMYDDYYKFCLFVVYNYTRFEEVTEQEVIDKINIKPQSIPEFCALLGFYTGFEEFKEALLHSNLMRIDQIRARMLGVNSEQIIDKMDKSCSNEEMSAYISTICKAIYKAKRVVLVGAMYPMSIAVEFQTDLITFGEPVIQYHNFDKDITLTKDDVTIFISATGRSMNDFIRIKQELRVEETTSILITQNKTYATPEYKVADYVLLVPGRFDGLDFNHQIMTIFDLLRVHYYQQYYL